MQLHKFWGKDRRAALTDVYSGHNLPEDKGPWLYERTVEVEEHDPEVVGASADEIIATIERDGYYMLGPCDEDGGGTRPPEKPGRVI